MGHSNTTTKEDTLSNKPVTPQLPALAGSTPLGFRPATVEPKSMMTFIYCAFGDHFATIEGAIPPRDNDTSGWLCQRCALDEEDAGGLRDLHQDALDENATRRAS